MMLEGLVVTGQSARQRISGVQLGAERLELTSRTSDRTEIETAVLLARIGHLLRAIALGDHDHRAAGSLKLIHIRIHAPGRGRTERTRSHTFRSLGRTGIIYRMILQEEGIGEISGRAAHSGQ